MVPTKLAIQGCTVQGGIVGGAISQIPDPIQEYSTIDWLFKNETR